MSKSGKPRGRETFLDMFRSMLVLGAAVALVLLVTWRPADSKPTVSPVDAHKVALGAQSQLSFTPLELDLGQDWQATSAWVEPVATDISKSHWHVSYIKDNSKYVAVDQSDTSAPNSFVNQFVQNKIEEKTIGNKTWVIYTAENSELIAVAKSENLTTLITANSYQLLERVLNRLS